MKKVKFLLALLTLATFQKIAAQTWTTSQMSIARYWLSAAANQQKMVAAGGILSSFEESNRVDIFDAATNKWTTKSLSKGRYAMPAVAAGKKIVIAGGLERNAAGNIVCHNAVDIFDVETGIWTTDTLSHKRGISVGVGVGNKAYFMAGRQVYQGPVSKTMDIYDTETNTWSVDTLPFAVPNMNAAAFGKSILLKGEYDWGIYDTELKTWTTEKFAKRTAVETSPIVTPTEIWFAGGVYNDPTYPGSDVILIFNIATKTWSELTMIEKRAGGIGCYLNGKVIIAGGQTVFDCVDATATSSVEIYDAATKNLTGDIAFLSTPRCLPTAGNLAPVIGNRAFIPGGDPTGECKTTRIVEIYTDTTLTRLSEPQLPAGSIQITPQPCSDFFKVKINLPTLDGTSLVLCNQLGQTLLSRELSANSPSEQIFEMSHLPSGTYFLKLSIGGAVLTKPVLKFD